MTTSLLFFFLCFGVSFAFLVMYLRPNFTLSSTALGLLLLFHGPAYWYYTRLWGLGEGVAVSLYNNAWVGADNKTWGGKGNIFDVDNFLELAGNFYDRIYAALSSTEIIRTMDTALALTMVFFCIGVWIADKVFKYGPSAQARELHCWRDTQILPLKHNVSTRLLIVSGCMILFMLYFMIKDDQIIKIYTYFFTEAGEFQKISMRREMGGSQSYMFNLMLGTLLPFVAFCLWIWCREGARVSIQCLAWTVIILVFIAKLATLSKAPATIFLLQLFVLEIARRSLQVSLRSILVLIGAGVLLFSVMTFVANSNLGGISQSLIFLFYRVFMIPNESLLEYFAVFPDQLSYTFGQDIRWLAALIGVEPLTANFWRVAEVLRGIPGSTTTAMFMADAWAAFSWTGVIASSSLFGFLLRWIDIQLIVRRGRSLATVAGLGIGYYGIFIALSTALQTALWTGGLLLILPFVLLLEWQWPSTPVIKSTYR